MQCKLFQRYEIVEGKIQAEQEANASVLLFDLVPYSKARWKRKEKLEHLKGKQFFEYKRDEKQDGGKKKSVKVFTESVWFILLLLLL